MCIRSCREWNSLREGYFISSDRKPDRANLHSPNVRLRANASRASNQRDECGLSAALLIEMRNAMTVLFLAAPLLVAQPPPPMPNNKALERRIEEIRARLERNSPTTPQQTELAAFAERYLEEAARALNNGKISQARQFADAADACRRPIDHLQHIEAEKAAPGRGGPPGKADDPQDHLRQIYFRLRLCDFFLQQIPPPAPTRLLELARGFYEQAGQAEQSHNRAAADEYAKASDDLTRALESLAQAALP